MAKIDFIEKYKREARKHAVYLTGSEKLRRWSNKVSPYSVLKSTAHLVWPRASGDER